MDDVIFMKKGSILVPLQVGPYETEDDLQSLLEDHPQLLAGAQMDRSAPRRFILIKREAPISDHEGGSGRWSIDHLYLDQDAIPTLVEVKRSTDTRIRREVVGQMLDYAANGTQYWSPEQLRLLFEKTCADLDRDAGVVLEDLLGDNADVDEYWARAGQNLSDRRLRLVFVSDSIPDELRSIIEFLNASMNSVDVFGIEVKSFVGDDGDECLVPRLIGSSATVEAKKRPSASLDELFVAAPIEVLAVRDRLAEWAQRAGLLESNAAQCFQIKDRQGTIARVYPAWKTVELKLSPFDDTRPDLVDTWLARLQDFAGEKKLTRVNPNMACTAALPHWERFEAVLNELATARAELDDAK